MTESHQQQPSESRLRRLWRRFYGAVQAMETSGCELMADRIAALGQRVGRLEALQPPPDGK